MWQDSRLECVVCRIRLFRNADKIQPVEHTIVQEYMDKPLLLDGYKIDLRLYALITHCDPLKVFLYQDGLVRLGTERYASPSESNVVRDRSLLQRKVGALHLNIF